MDCYVNYETMRYDTMRYDKTTLFAHILQGMLHLTWIIPCDAPTTRLILAMREDLS